MERIQKNMFDAALVPNFRQLVSEIYTKMSPTQENLATTLKQKLSNPAVWKVRACPVCGKKHNLELSPNTDDMQIVQCLGCGFTYSMQVLNEQYDKQCYAENDAFYAVYLQLKQHPVYRELEQKKARYIVQTANQFAKHKGHFLDVGSAVGSVVLAAQDHAWDATGIEANPVFINESKQKSLNIVSGFFPDSLALTKYAAFFHAISMLDVLEHMINPVEFLNGVKKYLTPAGIVLIQVPNLNSLHIQLDGRKNSNFCIGHWSYFTPTTLNATLEKAGFENVFLETYISEFDKIQAFSEQDIQEKIKQLTGKRLENLTAFNIDWLQANLLGYKIFGVYKLRA